MKKYLLILIVLSTSGMVCTKKKSTEEVVVRINKKIITKDRFNAFDRAARMYPTDPGAYFPVYRPTISHLIETEVLYSQQGVKKIRDSLEKTDDWKWKKRYYPAQIFLTDYIVENRCFPDEKIKAYYEAHKDSFKVTIKGDSTKKDSSYYRPLEEVRGIILDSLFLKENPPDSAFLAKYDSLPEKAEIERQWLYHIRQTLSSFFMKKIYKEMTGKPYPDSVSEIFGEGKYITQADMNVIMSWIEESRRQFYDSPERKKELVEWLVKWKLFSEYAEKIGRNKLPIVKQVLEWSRKLNAVYCYVTTRLEPALRASINIDTSMMRYAYYDDYGYFPADKDSASFSNKIKSEIEELMRMKVDSVIITYRRKYDITFLQNDWKDSKNDKPSELLAKADVLRDSGKTSEAKDAYEAVTKDFMLFPEGQNALVELAKLQTEQQLYTQAINNYRKSLLLNPDRSKRCNTFFMIGFIYDEYLDRPLYAEENYKWVLKNTPDCELADDAEFMMCHLDEPMTSVEELRDEAQRQGRKIDAEENEVIVEDTVQTSMKEEKK